ncbi:MAG: hypothetical protein NT056_01665 [Proteobacteria bacterium]|nr:hypothetical protein [Pseudomonadota bacterium]
MPIFDKPMYPQTTIISNGIYFFIAALCLALILIIFDQQVASIFNGFFEEPDPPYYPYFKQYLPLLVSFWGFLVGLYDYFKQKYIKLSGVAMVLNLVILVLYSFTLLL